MLRVLIVSVLETALSGQVSMLVAFCLSLTCSWDLGVNLAKDKFEYRYL